MNANDNSRAAEFFAPNAVEVNPAGERTVLRDQSDAFGLNSNLACSGHIRSIDERGQTAVAVVKLGEREGDGLPCGDIGAELYVAITVRDGKITLLRLDPR